MKRPPKSKIAPQAFAELQPEIVKEAPHSRVSVSSAEFITDPERPTPPEHWTKGALLNVRVAGAEYVVTLYPEEFDDRHPERALRFPNPARCQDFVSDWYSRQHHDPRAR